MLKRRDAVVFILRVNIGVGKIYTASEEKTYPAIRKFLTILQSRLPTDVRFSDNSSCRLSQCL